MFELRELSPLLAKKAAKELNESPENIAHKLPALREWVKSQKHLRSRTSDQFLIIFLRGAKFNLELAKQKLENYYLYKAKMPEVFYNRNPCDPKVYTILKLGCVSYLPEPIAEDGPTVGIIRPNRFDMKRHTIEDVFKVGAMAADILMNEEDNAIVAGYIVIMDLRDIPKEVLYNFNPVFARKLIMVINKASPTRMKGFHLLNVPTIFTKLFNLIKNAINDKLRDRIHVHDGNIETLYEYVPRHVLTKEYGGDHDDTEWADIWWQRFKSEAHFIQEEETYGFIEKHEPIYAGSSEFGMQGNFRNLSFD